MSLTEKAPALPPHALSRRSRRRQEGQSASSGASSQRVSLMAFQQTGQVTQKVSPKPFRSLYLSVLSLCIVIFYQPAGGQFSAGGKCTSRNLQIIAIFPAFSLI